MYQVSFTVYINGGTLWRCSVSRLSVDPVAIGGQLIRDLRSFSNRYLVGLFLVFLSFSVFLLFILSLHSYSLHVYKHIDEYQVLQFFNFESFMGHNLPHSDLRRLYGHTAFENTYTANLTFSRVENKNT